MESEKDLNIQDTKQEQPEETPIVCLIIKDMSDVYIRYDVISINLGCCF